MASAAESAAERSSSFPDLRDHLVAVKQQQPLSSNLRTFANLLLCIVGSGVLGLPYCFRNTGWVMGIVSLILSAFIVYNGMMLQIHSKRRLLRSRGNDLLIASFGDLIYHAFGKSGRLIVDVLLIISTLATGISYIIFISESVASIASSVVQGLSWQSSSIYAWFILPVELALSAIPSITLLAPFSAFGDTINFSALTALMVSDVLEIKKTSHINTMKAIGNLMTVPSSFGVGVYAFQSSGIMIPIESAMGEPLKLGRVMGVAFVLSGILYSVFALLGYAAFGENTQQVITLNLSNGIEAMVVKSAISFSLIMAFPLALNPMFELLERRFSGRRVSLPMRAVSVFIICLIATTVKQFVDLLSLAGSSVSCLLGFILPAAIHIKTMKEDMDNPPSALIYAADYLLILFGLVFGAFGTTMSVLEFF
ncbi:hypothetical protein KP509_01G114400 [Ceratopteris richardii]|uniref:Amino acid transporter transmembrane domain-containing protein n=1 Tax=Ceratopteris richardii TaxID=49495 RepID=A0A8T2VQ33_CERRI|nr:hypothetical protein KP509_01G114400 [Ceratopteris richardii]